jgi:all-trans-retinol dehydrogenase (NAD+)
MAATLTSAAFNPLLTVPAYLLLAQAPPNIRTQVLQHLGKYVSATTIARATSTLKWLAVLGIAGHANAYLNELSQNNFRFRSESHRFDWPKEVAVITGGTGGFGSRMAKGLAAKGVTVICVDIRDELPESMQGIDKIKYYKVDITDVKAVKAFGEEVKKTYGDPSILINNAGIGVEGQVLGISPEELRRIYEVNLLSHYYMLQQFLPAMIRQKKGHVVALASVASFLSSTGLSPYSGTKAAIVALHESLLQECRVVHNAPEIKFSIIHPTFADTAIIAPFKERLSKDGVKIITADEVADTVVKQILSCRGNQIVIGPGVTWLRSLRGLPQWFQQLIYRSTDKNQRAAEKAKKEARR